MTSVSDSFMSYCSQLVVFDQGPAPHTGLTCADRDEDRETRFEFRKWRGSASINTACLARYHTSETPSRSQGPVIPACSVCCLCSEDWRAKHLVEAWADVSQQLVLERTRRMTTRYAPHGNLFSVATANCPSIVCTKQIFARSQSELMIAQRRIITSATCP